MNFSRWKLSRWKLAGVSAVLAALMFIPVSANAQTFTGVPAPAPHQQGSPIGPAANSWQMNYAQSFFPDRQIQLGNTHFSFSGSGADQRLVRFYVVLDDNSLWGWGFNGAGELGDGTSIHRAEPVHILDNVFTFSAASHNAHGTALTYDGNLWAWGFNGGGHLGDGTAANRYRPVIVLDNVVSAHSGSGNTAALRADGTLWVWGANTRGVLGDGSTAARRTPFMVLDDVAAFSLIPYNSIVALRPDNSLWGWGYAWHDGEVVARLFVPTLLAENTTHSGGSELLEFVDNSGITWIR
ncbi:MAG: hypothetical protein FWD98_08085, partial [Defluviitaleaceae bacterium]|nr:hypothetical protein [Defluviitaleaceae bacterium]